MSNEAESQEVKFTADISQLLAARAEMDKASKGSQAQLRREAQEGNFANKEFATSMAKRTAETIRHEASLKGVNAQLRAMVLGVKQLPEGGLFAAMGGNRFAANYAIQGVTDFMSQFQTAGLGAALRGAANNFEVLGGAIHPLLGLIPTVAAVAVQAIPSLREWGKQHKEGAEAVEAHAKAMEKFKKEANELKFGKDRAAFAEKRQEMIKAIQTEDANVVEAERAAATAKAFAGAGMAGAVNPRGAGLDPNTPAGKAKLAEFEAKIKKADTELSKAKARRDEMKRNLRIIEAQMRATLEFEEGKATTDKSMKEIEAEESAALADPNRSRMEGGKRVFRNAKDKKEFQQRKANIKKIQDDAARQFEIDKEKIQRDAYLREQGQVPKAETKVESGKAAEQERKKRVPTKEEAQEAVRMMEETDRIRKSVGEPDRFAETNRFLMRKVEEAQQRFVENNTTNMHATRGGDVMVDMVEGLNGIYTLLTSVVANTAETAQNTANGGGVNAAAGAVGGNRNPRRVGSQTARHKAIASMSRFSGGMKGPFIGSWTSRSPFVGHGFGPFMGTPNVFRNGNL